MKQKKKTINNHIKLATTLILVMHLISCTTSEKRDKVIAKTLRKQNAVLQKIKEQRETQEITKEVKKNKELANSEEALSKAMVAILESNKAIISKLKPDNKEDTDCEQCRTK